MPSHSNPALGCRCRACHAARLAIWSSCTGAQRKAVSVLHFAIPRHQSEILQRDRLRYATIASLLYPHEQRPAMIRMLYLREAIATATAMPFFLLTQHGAEISAAGTRDERRAAMIRMLYLREAIATATAMPFFLLTQHGAEISAAGTRDERRAA